MFELLCRLPRCNDVARNSRSLLLVLGSLLVPAAAAACADDSWVGQRIMVRKAGVWIGHTDPFGRPVYVAELTDMVYTVVKEQDGWLAVRQRGQEDWLEKGQAVLLRVALSYFSTRIEQDAGDARAFALRGRTWRDAGDLDKALQDLDQALRLDSGRSAWFHERGLIHDERGAYQQALRDYTEALRLDPGAALVYNDRGLTHKALKAYREAILDYSQALALDPQRADTFFNRGNAYKSEGAYDQAIRDYSRAIRLDPHWPDAYFNRARANQARRAYDLALSDYREALHLDPQDADAHGSLAWLLATCPEERVRDGRQSVDYATKACELTSWEASYFLAILAAACAENGNFEEAVKWQKRALESPRYAQDEGETARRRIRLFEARQAYHEPAGPAYAGPKSDEPPSDRNPPVDPFSQARSIMGRLLR